MSIGRGLMAALASFFLGPGFGQAAMGRTKRGFLWLAAFAITLALSAVSVWMFLVAMAIWWLGAVPDAFWIAARREDDPPIRWFTTLSIMSPLSLLVWLGLVRSVLLSSYTIPASSMAPTLQIGDYVFVNKVSRVEPGDLIVFRYPCAPDRMYVKRLIARGGDRIEIRCNIVYVNAKALPFALIEAATEHQDYDQRDRTWFTRASSRYRETLGGRSYEVFHDDERPVRDRERSTQGDQRDFPSRGFGTPSCRQTDEALGGEGPKRGEIVETRPEGNACAPQLHYVVPKGHVFVLGDNRNNSNDSRVWGSVPDDAIEGFVVGIWMTRAGDDMPSLSRFGPVY